MPLITLGDDTKLKLKIPSKGDLNWSDDFKTQFAQKIVDHDHTGVDGKGKQLTGESLADSAINRASLLAFDLQDIPNVTNTLSDPNDPNSIVYNDNDILKYNVATNTWIPGPEGETYINISQNAQVDSFAPGSFVTVSTIDNLVPPNQYVLDFTSESSFKGIFLTINLSNPTTQKVILPTMDSCVIVSNVDVDLEGDLINTKILVRREGGVCTTTMSGTTVKMEGCQGEFDRLISGNHINSDVSRFIQSTILADELQTQLTDNNSNTLVVDQSEVIIDLLSNSSSLTTSAEYLKLQNKSQVTVKEFDATFPIDSTRVNVETRCMLMSRGDSLENTTENTLITWNPQKNAWNYLISPSGTGKIIKSNGTGVFVEEDFKFSSLDDYSTTPHSGEVASLGYSGSNISPVKETAFNVIKPYDASSDIVIQGKASGKGLNIKNYQGTDLLKIHPTANVLQLDGRVYLDGGTLNYVDRASKFESLTVTTTANLDGSGSLANKHSWSTGANYFSTPGIFCSNSSVENVHIHRFPSAAANSILQMFTVGSTGQGGSNTGTIGSISINTNSDGVNYNQTSDYRLKEDIKIINNPSNILMQLKPCSFKWKSSGAEEIGFIAHEVQEIFPSIVTGEKDAINKEGNIQAQAMDYGKLTPILTAALQEALVKIDALEARIKELEDK